MVSSAPAAVSFRFGPRGRFELQPQERRLLVDGQAAALGGRTFDLLIALTRHAGQLRSKEQLLNDVWPGRAVEESNLHVQVSALRKVLGDDVIVTVPGRGYRFEAAIKVADSAAAPAPRPDAAPSGPRTQLPAHLPTLFGRATELAALETLLAAQRLVTVAGPGGVGKSLLVQHLVSGQLPNYAHGVCWVELATTTDPERLPAVIADAVGVRIAGADPRAGLAAALAPLSLLIALDNAEHLLAAVAAAAPALLHAAPGLKLLVTSQVPLALRTEQVFRLGPLHVPDGPLPAAQALRYGAVALLADRAQAADARFALDDANAADAIALAHALDGLPLALELAAARMPALGLAKLAASMDQRLRLLAGTRADLPRRHRTLRAALEWSHALLGEAEQAVFRRLAVFQGGAPLELVQQVIADAGDDSAARPALLDAWAVLDALVVLVERSLVAVQDTDDPAWPRYRLLDSPRALAAERLAAAGEEAALRERHARAFARWCEAQWSPPLAGRLGRDAWAQRVLAEADNARAALAWAQGARDANANADAALAIATTMAKAALGGGTGELRFWSEAAWAGAARVRPALRWRALMARCWTWAHARPDLVFEAGREAVDLARGFAPDVAREPGHPPADRSALYSSLAQLAYGAALTGAPAAAAAALAEMAAIEDPAWPARLLAEGANASYVAAAAAGMAAPALAAARRFARLADGPRFRILALSNLIDAEMAVGDAAAAVHSAEALAPLFEGSRNEGFKAIAHANHGAALLMLGRAAEARPLLQAAWRQESAADLRPDIAAHLAWLAALEGRAEAAAQLAGYAQARQGARGRAVGANERGALERARERAAAALGAPAAERLAREGAALADAEIEALAFADALPGLAG